MSREHSAIRDDSVIRLAPEVLLHVQDDHSGFVESPAGVRRLRGTGLRLLADQLLPRLAEPARAADLAQALSPDVPRTRVLELLEVLREQQIIEHAPPARPTPREPAGPLPAPGSAGPPLAPGATGRLPGPAGPRPGPAAVGPLADPASVEPLPGPGTVGRLPTPRPVDPLADPTSVEPLPGPEPVDSLPGPGTVGRLPGPGSVGPFPDPGPVGPIPDPASVGRIPGPASLGPLSGPGTVAVLGPAELTCDLVAVLGRARVEVRDLGDSAQPPPSDAELLIASTASLFDPRAGAVNEWCVREGLPCLFYGLLPDGAAFAGPLWSPERAVACYACLRIRIFSNSVHGPVWSACTAALAASGAPALVRRVPPWTAARLAAAVARRATARLERPDEDPPGELLWLDEDGSETTRFLLPVPTCPVCGGRGTAGATGTTGTTRPIEAAGTTRTPRTPRAEAEAGAPPLTLAVDDKVGAVHSVSVRRAESGPPIYLAGSTSPDLSLLRPNLGVVRNGGAGFAKKEALNAAIGESLERCAAGLYRSSRLRTASYAQLGEEASLPSAFGLFGAEQYASPGFPFAPFTEDTPVRWVRATRWADGVACWVPASQVYLYYRRAKEETPIAPSISTGLAAGPSFLDAVLGGLSEILERDALSVSWLHRLPPRPVPEEVVAASPKVGYHLSGATSWRVSFYDLSLDLTPPVVVAVMDHRGAGGPVLSFGAACRISPVRAVEKAFLEAAQGLTYVRRLLKAYEGFEAATDFDRVDEFNKHAILYTRHPELRPRAGYLVHPSAPTPCDRPARPAPPDSPGHPAAAGDDVDLIVKELASIGLHTYVVDLTTPDTRRLGVHVVRVLVPGLQHLSGAHRFRMLGNPRLHTVVRKLGFDSAPDNPYPHPLP